MCGIAGIVSFSGIADREAVVRMGDALAHRGPDGHWHWTSADERAAFAYRRLAIMDPAHCLFEPFVWQEKLLVLYNGEIYNHRELRAELARKGYRFNSSSDAEVLPALYDCYGAACLERIDGMFAFALWDIQRSELFCARDRLGEKPFFYSRDNGSFRFASEIKAVRAGREAQTPLDERMLFRYLGYNLLEDPDDIGRTFYHKVNRLAPATWLRVAANGDVTQGPYWQLRVNPDHNIAIDEAAARFGEMLGESVARRMDADADVGCTLSGGLDSSSVLAMMRRAKPAGEIKSFTARIRDKRLDEGAFVATLLEHVPSQNHETWVDEGLLIQSLDELVAQQEEPVADLTVLAQAHVMKLVAANGMRVLLDGQGSDEMLAGYDYFVVQHLKDTFHQGLAPFRGAWLDVKEKNHSFGGLDALFYLDAAAPHLRRTLGRWRRAFVVPPALRFMQPGFAKPFLSEPPPFQSFESLDEALHYRTTCYGLHKLLRYADRNGMAHGIEVRFPFLDHRLVEFLFTLPPHLKIHHGWTKYVLRRAMEPLLPPSIAWRADKLGYTVPTANWLQHPRVIEMVRDAQHHMATRKIVKPDVRLTQREATAVLIASRIV